MSCPEETNPSSVGFGKYHLSSWNCSSNQGFPKDFCGGIPFPSTEYLHHKLKYPSENLIVVSVIESSFVVLVVHPFQDHGNYKDPVVFY